VSSFLTAHQHIVGYSVPYSWMRVSHISYAIRNKGTYPLNVEFLGFVIQWQNCCKTSVNWDVVIVIVSQCCASRSEWRWDWTILDSSWSYP